MKRYEFTGEALRAFRRSIIDGEVYGLDPDGFSADAETAESIIHGIDFGEEYDLREDGEGWSLVDGEAIIVGRIECRKTT